jgi:HTH-type transcriptional regulator / antitoxin HigA
MIADKESTYQPDYAVPPGETLDEILAESGMDQKELAVRLEMSPKTINQIIHGKAPITHETAIGLERVTRVPASFWLNREAVYRERLARIDDAKRLEADLDWLKDIPAKELRDRGCIQAKRRSPEMLDEVLSFFGVTSTEAWQKYWAGFQERFRIAARKSNRHETRDAALAVWIRLGQIEAQRIDCEPFDLQRFRDAVQQIRTCTTHAPEDFVPKMKSLCAQCGVAFVLVPEIKKVPWHGACWWITARKAVIELNLRGRTEDQYWFSFFHEAGHIAKQHSKKAVFINTGVEDDAQEREANEFAMDVLIPKERRAEIGQLHSSSAIRCFAEDLDISPGIVAGQYQRMTQCYNRKWVHNLKRRFEWVNSK